jgi:hypothetical protein
MTKIMSTIADTIRELKSVTLALKNVNLEAKKLREQKKTLEAGVLEYLQQKEQPGIKCDGFVVLAEQKDKRERKGKKQKLLDCSKLLESYGIKEPEKVTNELFEAMRGEKSTVSCLKTKDTIGK